MAEAQEATGEAIEALTAEESAKLEMMGEHFDALVQGIADRTMQLKEQVAQNLSDVASGFQEVNPERSAPITAKEALANLKAQEDVLSEYKANLERIAQMEGVSDALKAELSAGTEQAIADAGTLAEASAENAQKIVDQYNKVQTLKDEVAAEASKNLVPVQTPDEFAQTMRLYSTYGLEGALL